MKMLDNIDTLRLDKGKPTEMLGRKAMGLRLMKISYERQAAESLIVCLRQADK